MNLSFLDKWRKHPQAGRPGTGLRAGDGAGGDSAAGDPDSIAELLSECELLRVQAAAAGVELDDSAGSLEALDQLQPVWREDPDTALWLGTDAGLYLGTVLVRTVPGARWQVWPGGAPVVRLASDREIDVVQAGREWADAGAPELSQVYAEVAES